MTPVVVQPLAASDVWQADPDREWSDHWRLVYNDIERALTQAPAGGTAVRDGPSRDAEHPEIEQTLKQTAEIQARTDDVTGLFNRRHVMEMAERELTRALRYTRTLSLLMIDIDHFKAINDTWGH